MENKRDPKRTHAYVKWIAAAACLALFIIPFTDTWDWTRPVLIPFAGIVAALAIGMWFVEAARHARRPLKIGCCTALGLVLVLWVASILVWCEHNGTRSFFLLARGGVTLVVFQGSPDEVSLAQSLYRLPAASGWSCGRCRFPQNDMLLYALGVYMPDVKGHLDPRYWAHSIGVLMPFWLPALVIGLPTAWLIYRDSRRPRPGCCRHCGYDLTANLSGICPECGKPIPERVKAILAEQDSSPQRPS